MDFLFIFFGHFCLTHDFLVLWVWLAFYTSIGTQNVPLASKYMLTDTSQTLRYFQMLVQMLMQPSKMYPEPGFPDTIDISCKKLSLWPCISCTPHSAAPPTREDITTALYYKHWISLSQKFLKSKNKYIAKYNLKVWTRYTWRCSDCKGRAR